MLAFLPGGIEVVMLKSGQLDVNIYPLNEEVLKLIWPQDVNSWTSPESPWEASFKFHGENSAPAVVNEELHKVMRSLGLVMSVPGKNDPHTRRGSPLCLCFPHSAHHCVLSGFL